MTRYTDQGLDKVASNFAEGFDTLLSAYEQIGESIPLVEQYRALFTGSSHMDEALALVYGDILEFHRRALRLFTLPTWRQAFRSIWKDFNSRFEHILRDLRRHKELIESQATALHFQQYQADRQIIFEKFELLEIAETKRKYSAVLQWFAGADSLLDHEDTCKVRHEFPTTGHWILKHSKYSTWRMDDVPRTSTVWLNGIPGAGKTVLASLIIEDCLQEKTADTAFFYCKHGDLQRTTFVAILKTILSQLLKYDHDLLPWYYDNLLTSGQLSLSSEKLCKELVRALLLSGKKTFLVIDGLDECDRNQRKLLLDWLREIVGICDLQDPGKLRVIVLSQDEPDIRKNLGAFSEISLTASNNAHDIKQFVTGWCTKIQHKFGLEDEEVDYIIDSTCHRADGRTVTGFIWLKLR